MGCHDEFRTLGGSHTLDSCNPRRRDQKSKIKAGRPVPVQAAFQLTVVPFHLCCALPGRGSRGSQTGLPSQDAVTAPRPCPTMCSC